MRVRYKHTIRVLIIAQFGKSGGTRTYLSLLLDLLTKLDINIFLIADTNSLDEVKTLSDDYSHIKIFAPSFPLDPYPSSFPLCLIKTIWQIRDIIQYFPFDLTIVSASSGEAWIETLLLPWPTLYVIHTYPFWGRHSRRLGNVFWKLINRSLQSKNLLVTVSQASKKVIHESWLLDKNIESRIHIVYNPSRYENNSVSGKLKTNLKDEEFCILTVGSVENHKNPYFWIDIALTVKLLAPEANIQFVWVGDGSFLDAIRTYVQLYSWITFTGRSSSPDSYYCKASLYLQPSLVESQGMAVLEAASFSVPALVSDVGGLPEIVVDGETGYVLPVTSPWIYANKIIELWKNPKVLAQLGVNAHQLQKTKFSRNIWEEIMLDKVTDLTNYNYTYQK